MQEIEVADHFPTMSRPIERMPERQETSPVKEKYKFNFGVLTISGPSGAGKTRFAEELCDALGIPQENFFKAGGKVRGEYRKKSGEEIVGIFKRGRKVDQNIDSEQAEIIRNANPSSPIIMEGRLAAIIAAEENAKAVKEGKPPYPVITFNISVDEDVAAQRIFNRQYEKAHENGQPLPTRALVKRLTRERHEADLKPWSRDHAILIGHDPFDPDLKDEDGNQVYDYTINSSHASVNEMVQSFIAALVAHEALEPIRKNTETSKKQLPSSGGIYTSI